VSIEVIRARARDPRVLNGARYGQMVARAAAREREPPIVMYHQGRQRVRPQQELGAPPQ
jgi:hypothetical protein